MSTPDAPGSGPGSPGPVLPPVEYVFGTTARPGRTEGPLHAEHHQGQAWCGVKMQFRHWRHRGGAEAVTCARCLTALRRGRPYAWKSR